jgi:hypothetical protein
MPANDLGREKTPQWPEFGVPSEVRNLIDRFYKLVDTESEEAFLEGIDQFTTDGFTEINEKIVRGHPGEQSLEPSSFQQTAWCVSASRDHFV